MTWSSSTAAFIARFWGKHRKREAMQGPAGLQAMRSRAETMRGGRGGNLHLVEQVLLLLLKRGDILGGHLGLAVEGFLLRLQLVLVPRHRGVRAVLDLDLQGGGLVGGRMP